MLWGQFWLPAVVFTANTLSTKATILNYVGKLPSNTANIDISAGLTLCCPFFSLAKHRKQRPPNSHRILNQEKPFVKTTIGLNLAPYGCGSKNRYPTLNETLVCANMDQNLRNPSCLILSHTHIKDHLKKGILNKNNTHLL